MYPGALFALWTKSNSRFCAATAYKRLFSRSRFRCSFFTYAVADLDVQAATTRDVLLNTMGVAHEPV
jgi:hypothetical protein